MDSKYNNNNKEMFQNDSDFDFEAQEGWKEIGIENWDKIHQKLEKRIDEQIESSQKNRPKTLPLKKNTSWKYISIAAVFLVIVGFSLKLLLPTTTSDTLFEEYYRPLNAPEDNFRSDNAITIEEKVQQASDAYDELEHKKAIALYSELLKEHPNHPKYILFLGLSYINDERYDDAIKLYNSYNPQNVSYDEDIQWYLALAHLKKGEILTSKNLLINISQKEKNDYAQTAQELVAKLDKLK